MSAPLATCSVFSRRNLLRIQPSLTAPGRTHQPEPAVTYPCSKPQPPAGLLQRIGDTLDLTCGAGSAVEKSSGPRLAVRSPRRCSDQDDREKTSGSASPVPDTKVPPAWMDTPRRREPDPLARTPSLRRREPLMGRCKSVAWPLLAPEPKWVPNRMQTSARGCTSVDGLYRLTCGDRRLSTSAARLDPPRNEKVKSSILLGGSEPKARDQRKRGPGPSSSPEPAVRCAGKPGHVRPGWRGRVDSDLVMLSGEAGP